MTIRILLIDDHTAVRKGRRTFLSYNADLEVVGEASDGAHALSLAQELTPDIVVIYLLTPGMDKIAATAAVRRELPETEVLWLIAQGQSNKQIAHNLNNTKKTIKTLIASLLCQLRTSRKMLSNGFYSPAFSTC